MKNIRLYLGVSLLIVLILLFGIFSKSDDQPQDNPKLEATVSAEEEHSQEEANRDPVESEIEIFNQLNSGFFYTSPYFIETADDKAYVESRSKTLQVLTDHLLTLAKSSGSFTEGSLSDYENHLMGYLDTYEIAAEQSAITEITQGILSYRTALNALQKEITAYSEIDGSDLEPVIQGSIFTKSIELYNMTNSYLDFLLTSKEYIGSVFAKSSPEKVDAFNRYANRIYTNGIAQEYTTMMLDYLDAGQVYAYISSADYYAGQAYSLKLQKIIDTLDDSEDALAIKGIYGNAISDANLPAHLISQDAAEETTEISYFDIISHLFVNDVYADTLYSIEDAVALMSIFETIEFKSQEGNSDDLIADAIMDIIISGNAQNNNITIPALVTKDAVDDDTPLQLEIKRELKKERPEQVNNMNALQDEKKAQDQKQLLIKDLKEGQEKLNVIGMGKRVELIFGGDGSNTLDLQYAAIIAAATKQVKEKGGNLDSEIFEKINTMLNTKLEVLLGEKKEVFVNKFIETSAEELVDQFAAWKKNALNFEQLRMDKNTMLSLLSTMGIDLKSPEDTVSNNPIPEQEVADDVVDYDIDELFPEQLSIPSLESLGFELLNSSRETNDNRTYYFNVNHTRPREYNETTDHANLYSYVRARIVFNIPDDKYQPLSRSSLSRDVGNAYENEVSEDYRLTAWRENRGIGNSGIRYELLRGELQVVADPMTIEINFNDIMIDEYPNIKSIMKNFASSLVAKVDGNIEQFKSSEKPQPEQSEAANFTLSGSLTLLDLYKASHMKAEVSYFDPDGNYMNSVSVTMDQNGSFSTSFPYPVDQGYKAILSIPLIYFDEKDTALFFVTDNNKNVNEPITLFGGEYAINSEEDLAIECDLYGAVAYDNEPVVGQHFVDAQTYVYFYQTMKEAVEYYQNEHQYDFKARLPLRVILNEEVESTKDTMGYYDYELGAIHVMQDFTSIDTEAMPHLIYHELSHHIMTMLYYPDYPGDRGIDTDTYHGGYANSYTGYSFSEGFAFFMESIMGIHYYNEPEHDIGDLEVNHKAWENSGYSETIAVASLLYDLIDSGESDDDAVALSMDDLWKVLSHNQFHVGNVYDELKSTYPELSEELDQVFINHGFYTVTDREASGANIYNFGEAFVDLNGNNAWDEGEVFYDYNAFDENGNAIQKYRDDYTAGYAGYADQVDRK